MIFFKILNENKLTKKYFIGNKDERLWNIKYVTKYLEKYDDLCKKFLLLVHLTSGMPARASELEKYLLSNSPYQIRTSFYADGRIFFIPYYNKTDNIAEKKFIARFMSKETSKLILDDILIIRPFVTMLYSKVKNMNKKNEYQNYFFVLNGSLMNARQIREIFQEEYIKYMDMTINFSCYRQCVGHLVYSNKIYGYEHYNEEYDDDEETYDIGFHSQMGHSKKTAKFNYGKSTKVCLTEKVLM